MTEHGIHLEVVVFPGCPHAEAARLEAFRRTLDELKRRLEHLLRGR